MIDNSKNKNIIKHIKNSMIFEISNHGNMFIFAMAVAKDEKKNEIQKIIFDSGVSISAGVYDTFNNCFYVKCEDYLFIGSIPLCVFCRVEENQNWVQKVPLSKNVLDKVMEKSQKKILRSFLRKYPEENYKLEFLQLYNSRYK